MSVMLSCVDEVVLVPVVCFEERELLALLEMDGMRAPPVVWEGEEGIMGSTLIIGL
jgi:hypothetical protein